MYSLLRKKKYDAYCILACNKLFLHLVKYFYRGSTIEERLPLDTISKLLACLDIFFGRSLIRFFEERKLRKLERFEHSLQYIQRNDEEELKELISQTEMLLHYFVLKRLVTYCSILLVILFVGLSYYFLITKHAINGILLVCIFIYVRNVIQKLDHEYYDMLFRAVLLAEILSKLYSFSQTLNDKIKPTPNP